VLLERSLEIKIDDHFGKEYQGKYLFVGISWGVSNRITAECTKVNPVSRQSVIDLKTLQARMLMATLVQRPKIITLEHLLDETKKGLSPALGELLMAAADKVNGYSKEDREEVKKLKQRWGLE